MSGWEHDPKNPNKACRQCGQDISPEDVANLEKEVMRLQREHQAKRSRLLSLQLCFCDERCQSKFKGEI